MNIDIASIDMVSEVNMVSSRGSPAGAGAGAAARFPSLPFSRSRRCQGQPSGAPSAALSAWKLLFSPQTRFPRCPPFPLSLPRVCVARPSPGVPGCLTPPFLLLLVHRRSAPAGARWGSAGSQAPCDGPSQPAGCGAERAGGGGGGRRGGCRCRCRRAAAVGIPPAAGAVRASPQPGWSGDKLCTCASVLIIVGHVEQVRLPMGFGGIVIWLGKAMLLRGCRGHRGKGRCLVCFCGSVSGSVQFGGLGLDGRIDVSCPNPKCEVDFSCF